MSTISYAHIAAGEKVDVDATLKQEQQLDTNTEKLAQLSVSETDSSSDANQDTNAEDSDDNKKSTQANKDQSANKATNNSAKKSSGKKPSTNDKKAQLKLAPAPVPTVSAWKNAATSSTSTVTPNGEWESPLAQQQKSIPQVAKKPVAKNTGKEKWVPYEASVVISAPSKPKSHKKVQKKKNNGVLNGSKPVNTASGSKGKKKTEKKEETKKDVVKEATEVKKTEEELNNNSIAPTSGLDGASSETPAANAANADVDAAPTENGVSQQDKTPQNVNSNYKGNRFKQNFYKGKPYANKYNGEPHTNHGNSMNGNGHGYHNNAGHGHGHNNHNHGHGNQYVNGNANGFQNFKPQPMPFTHGFVPKQGPFPQFYPAFNPMFPPEMAMPMMMPKNGAMPVFPPNFIPEPEYMAPMDPAVLHEQRIQAIIKQVSYYFSTENLDKDTFLRGQMNSQGFIPISTIADFKRVKILSQGSYNLVVEAMERIDFIEVANDKVRLAQNYEQWVLPESERTEAGKD